MNDWWKQWNHWVVETLLDWEEHYQAWSQQLDAWDEQLDQMLWEWEALLRKQQLG